MSEPLNDWVSTINSMNIFDLIQFRNSLGFINQWNIFRKEFSNVKIVIDLLNKEIKGRLK